MPLALVERVRRVGELPDLAGLRERAAGHGVLGEHRHRLADHPRGGREERAGGPVQLAGAAARPREQPDQHADAGADHDVHHPRLGQPPVHRRDLREDERDDQREQGLRPAQAEQRAGGEADQHHDGQRHRVHRRGHADDEQRRGDERARGRADQRRAQRRAGLGGRGAQQR